MFAAAVVVQPQPKCAVVDSRELPETLYIGESERRSRLFPHIL